MTVSPAGTPGPDQPALPDAIGWLFVERYYEVYTKDIANLYKLYDKEAVVSHDQFPASAAPDAGKVEFHARGTEAIREHFRIEAGDVPKTNRVVITGADFQFSFKESILIVVTGEWARGDSTYWQFMQTFVLTPSKEKVYDVANDILKFVDHGEFRDLPVVKREREPLPEHASEKAENGKVDEKPEEKPKVVIAEKTEKTENVPEKAPVAEKPAQNGQVKEEKVATVEAATEKDAEPETDKAGSGAETPASAEKTASTETPVSRAEAPEPATTEASGDTTPAGDNKEKPASPQPILWAALAAKEPPKATASTASVASPAAVKSVPTPTPVVKKAASPQQVPPPYANGKFKKSDWFPIYVRNVEVGQEELKAALDKQFGKTKYFVKNERVVLCDFYTREAQEKALKAKEIRLGNNTIYLEPREARNHKDAKKKAADKKVNAKKNPKPVPVKKA